MTAVIILTITIVQPSLVAAFATGPLDDACKDATPQHVTPRNTYYQPQQQGCPYMVYFEQGFTPGESHTLTITSWTGEDEFKGYMLLVLNEESKSVGEFATDHRTICGGAAVTHSNSDNKLSEEVQWTAPVNSSGQTYHIWLTVVRSYRQFWVNCDPVILPHRNIQFNETMTPTELATDDNGDPIGFTWPPIVPPVTATESRTTAEMNNINETATATAAASLQAEISRNSSVKPTAAPLQKPTTAPLQKPDGQLEHKQTTLNRSQSSQSVMENTAIKSNNHFIWLLTLTIFFIFWQFFGNW